MFLPAISSYAKGETVTTFCITFSFHLNIPETLKLLENISKVILKDSISYFEIKQLFFYWLILSSIIIVSNVHYRLIYKCPLNMQYYVKFSFFTTYHRTFQEISNWNYKYVSLYEKNVNFVWFNWFKLRQSMILW